MKHYFQEQAISYHRSFGRLTLMADKIQHRSSGKECKARRPWTSQEDQLLADAVAQETPPHGHVNWHRVSDRLPGRNNKQCRKRWHYSIAHTVRKGTWTPDEDARLRVAVDVHGTRWSKIAEVVGSRNGDQCWKRWYDCVNPDIDKSPWTLEEDVQLLAAVAELGRNWTEIVRLHFPNRTSLSAKNRHSALRRRSQPSSAVHTPSAASPASVFSYSAPATAIDMISSEEAWTGPSYMQSYLENHGLCPSNPKMPVHFQHPALDFNAETLGWNVSQQPLNSTAMEYDNFNITESLLPMDMSWVQQADLMPADSDLFPGWH
ncbi:hypothetical protein QBC46DRAFT_381393 [Diplogelasinospora grovesii]|uniref:Uncharacterized protein n=1 Tax=Diplogelasinospora grovesii TaxID=303347 RepID=A0AAN6NB46_9PEZI|nr:hypothetical protein QBC46DRAFT_381393 [Diplogelasinospora grovesii]